MNYDSQNKISNFNLYEFEDFAQISLNSENIGSITDHFLNIGLSYVDESFFNGELHKGKFVKVNLIRKIEYTYGNFKIFWSEEYADSIIGEGLQYTKLNYSIAKQMEGKSWTLYEYLKVQSKHSNDRVFSLSLLDIRNIYKLYSKSSESYKHINRYYLKKQLRK